MLCTHDVHLTVLVNLTHAAKISGISGIRRIFASYGKF